MRDGSGVATAALPSEPRVRGRGGGGVLTRGESRSGADPPANRARPTRNWRQMLDNKRKTSLIALLGAVALMASAPAFAQNAAEPAARAAASAEGNAAAAPADAGNAANAELPPQMQHA